MAKRKTALLLFAVVLMSACGGSGGSGETVHIGVLNTMSGELASFGPAVEESLGIAEIQLNERLAAEGSPFSISFDFEDTGTTPEGATRGIQALYERGVRVVIGPMSSSEVEAVSQYSASHEIVLISPSSTSADLARSDDLILRTVAPDGGQAAAVAAAFRYYGTRFYCPVWRGDDFGDDLTLLVAQEIEHRGGKFAPGARYAPSTTDFSPVIHQLEVQLDAYRDFFGVNSAAVYAVAFDEVFGLLKQANARLLLKDVRWYGSDGIALNARVFEDPEVASFMYESHMLSPIYSGDKSAPEFAPLRSQIEEALGRPVRPYALLAYDAAALIGEAFTALGTQEVTGAALRDAVITVSAKTTGATGALTLDSNGDRMPGAYEFWKVEPVADGTYRWKLGGTFNVPNGDYSKGTFVPDPD